MKDWMELQKTRIKMPKIVYLVSVICVLFVSRDAFSSDAPVIAFSNHGRLVYSDPVPLRLSKKFGPGWTRLTLHQASGNAVPLMPEEQLTENGGVIFSNVGRGALSPTGRYLALDLTRNTIVQGEDGKPLVQSREYCPILDTTTGCIARDETGSICGGAWDTKTDAWQGDLDSAGPDSQSMDKLEKPTAKSVWTSYSTGKIGSIQTYLRPALGLSNVMACDPPNTSNAAYYEHINAQLTKEPEGIKGTSGSFSTTGDDSSHVWTIQIDRAYLHERPSQGSNRRGYLIRGDQVTLLSTDGADWAQIRYKRAGKPPIDAWVRQQEIAR